MYYSKILALLVLQLSYGCTPSVSELKVQPFPKSYNLAAYQKIKLQNDMEEVSGLQWVGDDQIWAIEDESSIIYNLDTENGKILKKHKFAKNKDIEDLLEINDVAWVLQSNGTLYEVKSPFTNYKQTKEYHFPIKEKRDIEAIVASKTEPYLYIFCKACKWDKGPEQSSVFRFDLHAKSYDSIPFKILKREDIQPLLGYTLDEPLAIQPSAAALHPIENQVYIISSTGKWLVIADTEFTPKEVYKLDPRLFKQPEGITFDPKGNMYIANEAQDGVPNILKFSYNP